MVRNLMRRMGGAQRYPSLSWGTMGIAALHPSYGCFSVRRQTSDVRPQRTQQGFTLVEILVAMLIMAVVSVLAYNAFDGVLAMEERSKKEFLAENRRSLATSIVLNDLIHLRARPVRDQLGGVKNAYLAPSGEYAVEFSRGGLPDFPTMPGGLQRVAYRVADGQLIRTTWEVLDLGPATVVSDQVLATGIAALRVEQLDSRGQFIPVWPPLDEQQMAPEALPALVRLTLELEGGEEMRLLIPGPEGLSTNYTPGGG